MEHPNLTSTKTSAVEAAARALGLDPTTLAFSSARNVNVQPTLLIRSAPLTDEEWEVIGPLCPVEDRTNSWSWREFIDTELWALSPKNTLSSLSNANAHRCRRRRASVRRDFDRLLVSVQDVEGISAERKKALIRIFEACSAEGERARAKVLLAEASRTDRHALK